MLLSQMGRQRIQKRWAGPRVEFVAMALGMASFLMEELMHFLLVPNIGRHWERLVAEIISAVVVGWLAALLMKAVNRHRAAILLRMQVISEMNEHVRTALDEISLTTQSIENQQCIRKISESVGHIEWALREVLLRPLPVPEGLEEHRQGALTRRALGVNGYQKISRDRGMVKRTRFMRRRNLKELRVRLEQKREEVTGFLSHLETETRSLEQGIPQDSADRSVLNLSQESLFEQASQRRLQLRRIEGALKRIKHGSFGKCQACEQEISERRLQALPWTQYCLQCQQMLEQGILQITTVEAELTGSSRRTE